MAPQRRLAYDLYAASFFVADRPNVRLVMLVSAVEALVEQVERPAKVVEVINELISETNTTGPLDGFATYQASIMSSLRELRRESISSSLARAAESLGDETYGEMSAGVFVKHCYRLRSSLVHGAVPAPSNADVSAAAAPLEPLVGDLIAQPLPKG